MSKNETKKRIEKLKEVINHHRYLYHVQDRQEITDAALDSLKHELYELEKNNPEFLTLDSPTQRVGGAPLPEFKKVKHDIPMLSIEDIFAEKELQDWEEYLKRLEPGVKFQFFAELKIDGFAISLIYENGLFSVGSTRGDGKNGEDVTQNLKTIESIPLKLDLKTEIADKKVQETVKKLINNGKIEIRGEVYIDKRDFERFNQALLKKGEKTFANPRNLAAGSIRQLNPQLAASRPLKFLAYDILTDMGQAFHSQEHAILPLIGFKTDHGEICENLSDTVNFWREINRKRDNLPFQIDGVVISIDNNELFNKLGVAGKSPRAIRAFKFSPQQATTKVLDIKLQVGRTGAITPVAILRPTVVGGVTITRATLHNEEEIRRLGVRIGDTIIVERAGDVIPAVAKVITELRTGKEESFRFPRKCPVCEASLIKPEGEAIWRCLNPKCPAKKRENLYYFTSRKAFDIKGLGPKIVDQLVNNNLVSTASDIFQLEEGDLLPLFRFGEKSAQNLIKAIQNSKKITLAKFIFALGIRHAGEETAVDLADHFGSIDKLKKASKEEINLIPNIGNKIAESIYNWFQERKNQKLIEELLIAGVEIEKSNPSTRLRAGILREKTFVLTGALDSMTREIAKDKIRFLGGKISETISRKTDYLIAGKEPSSKLEKAKKLGVKIINEPEFLKIVK